MNNEELKLFIELLPAFSNHFQTKKNTLLAKIYGVFTIKTKYCNDKKEFHFMLMENTA